MTDLDRARLVMETVKRVLDASGLDDDSRVRVLLACASIEHRVADTKLPAFVDMAAEAAELAELAEHPGATTEKGDA